MERLRGVGGFGGFASGRWTPRSIELVAKKSSLKKVLLAQNPHFTISLYIHRVSEISSGYLKEKYTKLIKRNLNLML